MHTHKTQRPDQKYDTDMKQNKIILKLLFIILLVCLNYCKSKNCNRIQFDFLDQNGINTSQNFTEQTFRKNGQPVYYSYSRTADYKLIQIIIWRNSENNKWLSQTIINHLTPSTGNNVTKTNI